MANTASTMIVYLDDSYTATCKISHIASQARFLVHPMTSTKADQQPSMRMCTG